MTPEKRSARRRSQWERYNRSAKGRARYLRYEARHPERAQRWPLQSSDRLRRGSEATP